MNRKKIMSAVNVYNKKPCIKAIFFTFFIIILLTSVRFLQAAPSEFDIATLEKIKMLMPDVFERDSFQGNNRLPKTPTDKDIFIDQKVKIPVVINDSPRKKILRVNNKGDVGGYFDIKITGSAKNVRQYKESLKIYDLKMVRSKPKEYDLFLSRRDKIIARDEKIRADRKRRNAEILTNNLELRRSIILKRKEEALKAEKVRIDRAIKNKKIIDRDKKIREARAQRSRTDEKLSKEWEQINKNNRIQPTKKKRPLYQYNPRKDLLIEISLHNSNVKQGFFIMSFDPDINKGQRHVYRPVHIEENYNAHVDVLRGQLHLQLVERGSIDRQGFSNILEEKTVGIATNAISHRSDKGRVSVDLVMSSITDVSTYRGSIAGWSE